MHGGEAQLFFEKVVTTTIVSGFARRFVNAMEQMYRCASQWIIGSICADFKIPQ